MQEHLDHLLLPFGLMSKGLKVFFVECFINYVNREANGAAHCCAKFANPVDSVTAWTSSAPNFLVATLVKDFGNG
jgi:hypothetical protein